MPPEETRMTPVKPLVAICSRDAEFYLILNHILDVDGYMSTLASTGEEMLELAAEMPVRAWILDCRPDHDMAANCRRIRQDAEAHFLPLIALIAPGAENQHIELLKSGIDKCFIRPTAPATLLEYLHAKLGDGRQAGWRAEGSLSLSYGEIEMQIDAHHVRCNGQEIMLGPIEFKLLRHMLENPKKVLSRDELTRVAWPGNVYVGPRTVDVHISRLRKSLKSSCRSDLIRTVRLGGYALEHQLG